MYGKKKSTDSDPSNLPEASTLQDAAAFPRATASPGAVSVDPNDGRAVNTLRHNRISSQQRITTKTCRPMSLEEENAAEVSMWRESMQRSHESFENTNDDDGGSTTLWTEGSSSGIKSPNHLHESSSALRIPDSEVVRNGEEKGEMLKKTTSQSKPSAVSKRNGKKQSKKTEEKRSGTSSSEWSDIKESAIKEKLRPAKKEKSSDCKGDKHLKTKSKRKHDTHAAKLHSASSELDSVEPSDTVSIPAQSTASAASLMTSKEVVLLRMIPKNEESFENVRDDATSWVSSSSKTSSSHSSTSESDSSPPLLSSPTQSSGRDGSSSQVRPNH